jgi:hypothetical protein
MDAIPPQRLHCMGPQADQPLHLLLCHRMEDDGSGIRATMALAELGATSATTTGTATMAAAAGHAEAVTGASDGAAGVAFKAVVEAEHMDMEAEQAIEHSQAARSMTIGGRPLAITALTSTRGEADLLGGVQRGEEATEKEGGEISSSSTIKMRHSGACLQTAAGQCIRGTCLFFPGRASHRYGSASTQRWDASARREQHVPTRMRIRLTGRTSIDTERGNVIRALTA